MLQWGVSYDLAGSRQFPFLVDSPHFGNTRTAEIFIRALDTKKRPSR
jgi:hypothetical protein